MVCVVDGVFDGTDPYRYELSAVRARAVAPGHRRHHHRNYHSAASTVTMSVPAGSAASTVITGVPVRVPMNAWAR